jgi:hypothetical protein
MISEISILDIDREKIFKITILDPPMMDIHDLPQRQRIIQALALQKVMTIFYLHDVIMCRLLT